MKDHPTSRVGTRGAGQIPLTTKPRTGTGGRVAAWPRKDSTHPGQATW
jgi:hypothetical protein